MDASLIEKCICGDGKGGIVPEKLVDQLTKNKPFRNQENQPKLESEFRRNREIFKTHGGNGQHNRIKNFKTARVDF